MLIMNNPLQLDPEEDFEPSQAVKKRWLGVRKIPKNVAGIDLPGIFSLDNIAGDTTMFFTVFILEIIGITFLKYARPNMGYLFIFAFIIVDFILAIFRHYPIGKICELGNEILIQKAPAIRAKLERDKKKKIWQSRIPAGLIIFVAVFKVIAFYTAVHAFNMLVVAILLSYACVAWIHINHTGYYLWACWADFYFKRERNTFQNNLHNNQIQGNNKINQLPFRKLDFDPTPLFSMMNGKLMKPET